MKITHIGTGEAFDENLPNNSHLVSHNGFNLLLDCGYSIPYEIWKRFPDTSFLDAIFISHAHADHYFGIPPLLVRMLEDKRAKPLIIICDENTKSNLNKLITLAYKGVSKAFCFEIDYITNIPHQTIRLHEMQLNFAYTNHMVPNLIIRIDIGDKSIGYSGDGIVSNQSGVFFNNSDLLIHEAFLYNKEIFMHSCMERVVSMADQHEIKNLALTHLRRDFVHEASESLEKIDYRNSLNVYVPKPGDIFDLDGDS